MKKSIFVIAVLLISACSSGPTRPPQENAIFHALTHDSALRQVVDHCSALSVELKNTAWQTQQSWWKRNGSFVEAAEYGFSFNLIRLNGDRQSAGARYAMAVAMDVALEAEALARSTVTAGNNARSCEAELAKYNDGEKDLNKNQELYNLLVSLDQQKTRNGKELYRRQAQMSTKTGEKYSRSSITAERLVSRNICQTPKIRTLKASWPAEIFEANCPDKSSAVVTCDWGNCKILK